VGMEGNVIRIAPPLTINQEEIEMALQIMRQVLKEL